MLPSHTVRVALNVTLDNVTLNRQQALACFNPDREINSLAERIVALRHHGVAPDVIRTLLADVKTVLALNDREGAGTLELAGHLDEMATLLADDERNDGHVVRTRNTKNVAADLRVHLRTLRERPTDAKAWTAVARIVESTPRERLGCSTMRRQLGHGPFEQLHTLIGQMASVAA